MSNNLVAAGAPQLTNSDGHRKRQIISSRPRTSARITLSCPFKSFEEAEVEWLYEGKPLFQGGLHYSLSVSIAIVNPLFVTLFFFT